MTSFASLDVPQDDINQRIDNIERVRRDFVANVSHELRTPLTVIHGYMEILIEREKGSLYEKIFNEIFTQTKRMENLVTDLLLLSKLQSSKQHQKEIVNAVKMIEVICEEAKSLFQAQNHAYHVYLDKNLRIEGDEEELKSVFYNLILNACKYTLKEGEITIAWFQSKDKAIFEVKDTGIGIENKHLSRLTERFYRVDKARSRDSGGTGLGLAIVKHALMRHNAQLVINSTPGVGSCFRAVFPISENS